MTDIATNLKRPVSHVHAKLFRGPRPESLDQFAVYKALGTAFTEIVNLQSGAFEFFNDDLYEEQRRVAEITITELKCSDVFPPTKKQVEKFLAICRRSKGAIYLHCLHGKDRTGFMVAVYRMRVQKWGYFKAVKELFSFGFHWFFYWPWLFALIPWRFK